jgi:hypothetical protein
MRDLTVFGNWTALHCNELVRYSLRDKHSLHDDKLLKTHALGCDIMAGLTMSLIDA